MKINYIQGLKGLSMLIVVIMHFYLVYINEMIDNQIGTPPHLIINGNLAVCVFLILSGYVAGLGLKKLQMVEDYQSAILKRYLRIALPTSIVVAVTFIMFKVGLFQVNSFSINTGNELASIYYDNITIRQFLENLLLSPFGKCKVIGPCWMLGYIFIGSLIVFMLNVITNKFSILKTIVALAITVFILRYLFSIYYSCVIMGLLLYRVNTFMQDKDRLWYIQLLGLFLFVSGIFIEQYSDSVFTPRKDINALSAILMVTGISMSSYLKSIFSFKPLVYLGNISFSIFLIHWPVICSFSIWLYEAKIAETCSGQLFIMFFTSITLILFLSHVFSHYIESKVGKASNIIVNSIVNNNGIYKKEFHL